jgi:hypothetical protein
MKVKNPPKHKHNKEAVQAATRAMARLTYT